MLFAEIDPLTNIVLRVIVCESNQWCVDKLGGTWEETYDVTEGKNYAGVGSIFHPDKQNFSTPQPYPSWIFNEDCQWEAPKPHPDDGKYYEWNEDTQEWIEILYK